MNARLRVKHGLPTESFFDPVNIMVARQRQAVLLLLEYARKTQMDDVLAMLDGSL